MNENDFIQYLKITPTKKGNHHTDSRIKNMLNLLKEVIPNKLSEFDDGMAKGDLLEIDDLQYLDNLKKRLNGNGDLQKWDKVNHGNGGGSASLYQYINFLKHKNRHIDSENNSSSNKIRNSILYGSPGVGKTHNTNKLIRLIEDGKGDREIFETIKKNKNSNSVDISDIKERVKFITFHQSFGYEDFIEGFRPNEDGDIGLEKGIFLKICKDAQKNLDNSLKAPIDIGVEKKFKVLFELFKDSIQDEIDMKQKFIINDTAYITNIEENAFRYQGDNWGNTQRMKFDDIELLYSKNISERKDIKTVDGISGLAKQHATYFSYFMKKLLDFENNENIQVDSIEKIERQKYYLVIDEINRGNISKIFGELITLIEEDKRDNLEVTLPYSKQPFKIPSNLYIIGTMNSTDKSIALIDIALRRRFTFLKMEPNAELITLSKAKEIFIALNKRIVEDLGEDYQIGHSYFMKIADNNDLDFVLEYKIIPLLEEYYYGDDRLKEIVKLCNHVEINNDTEA